MHLNSIPLKVMVALRFSLSIAARVMISGKVILRNLSGIPIITDVDFNRMIGGILNNISRAAVTAKGAVRPATRRPAFLPQNSYQVFLLCLPKIEDKI